MKILHLVTPRTGPNNAGPQNCLICGADVFNKDGSIAYDPAEATHTTDVQTLTLKDRGRDERPAPVQEEIATEVDFQSCTEAA